MDLQVDAAAEVKYIPQVELATDGPTDEDTHIVNFEGEHDPEDPLN